MTCQTDSRWSNRQAVIAILVLLTGCLAGCSGDTGTTPLASSTSSDAPNASDPSGHDGAPGQSHSVSGIVRLIGKPIPPRTITATKDPEHCGAAAGDFVEMSLSKDQGIVGAVVEVQGLEEPADGWQWPTETHEIHQKECMFTPYISVIPMNKAFSIFNDDPVAHNVNSSAWNVVQGPNEAPISRSLDRKTPTKLNCNVHNWMECWVYPARSPWVTRTDEQGRFSLTDVPPGTHRLVVWHPAIARKRIAITVGEEPATVSVEMESPIE